MKSLLTALSLLACFNLYASTCSLYEISGNRLIETIKDYEQFAVIKGPNNEKISVIAFNTFGTIPRIAIVVDREVVVDTSYNKESGEGSSNIQLAMPKLNLEIKCN